MFYFQIFSLNLIIKKIVDFSWMWFLILLFYLYLSVEMHLFLCSEKLSIINFRFWDNQFAFTLIHKYKILKIYLEYNKVNKTLFQIKYINFTLKVEHLMHLMKEISDEWIKENYT